MIQIYQIAPQNTSFQETKSQNKNLTLLGITKDPHPQKIKLGVPSPHLLYIMRNQCRYLKNIKNHVAPPYPLFIL